MGGFAAAAGLRHLMLDICPRVRCAGLLIPPLPYLVLTRAYVSLKDTLHWSQ